MTKDYEISTSVDSGSSDMGEGTEWIKGGPNAWETKMKGKELGRETCIWWLIGLSKGRARPQTCPSLALNIWGVSLGQVEVVRGPAFGLQYIIFYLSL